MPHGSCESQPLIDVWRAALTLPCLPCRIELVNPHQQAWRTPLSVQIDANNDTTIVEKGTPFRIHVAYEPQPDEEIQTAVVVEVYAPATGEVVGSLELPVTIVRDLKLRLSDKNGLPLTYVASKVTPGAYDITYTPDAPVE